MSRSYPHLGSGRLNLSATHRSWTELGIQLYRCARFIRISYVTVSKVKRRGILDVAYILSRNHVLLPSYSLITFLVFCFFPRMRLSSRPIRSCRCVSNAGVRCFGINPRQPERVRFSPFYPRSHKGTKPFPSCCFLLSHYKMRLMPLAS